MEAQIMENRLDIALFQLLDKRGPIFKGVAN